MTAPTLGEADIREEVERIFSREHRSHLVAVYGRGQAGEVRSKIGTWQVVPTACELELRAKMPMPGREEYRVFLIDWTDHPLPVDLASRLAGGRVYRIANDIRLATLFGAREAESGLTATGLAAILLGGEISGLRKVSGLQLSRRDAYLGFVQAWLQLDWKDGSAGEFVAWCVRNERGPALAHKAASSEAWRRLRDELRDFWSGGLGSHATLGPVGGLAWQAWEQGLGKRFVQVLLLLDAWRTDRDPVARGLLLGRLGDTAPGFGPGLLERVDELGLDPLLQDLQSRVSEGGWWQTMASEAETLLPQTAFRSTLESSRFLPAGHAARENGLASSVHAALAGPSNENLTAVVARHAALVAHAQDAAVGVDAKEGRERGVALVLWLGTRARRIPSEHGPVWQRAVDLARQYVNEGGFVDWCRQQLRRPFVLTPALGAALRAVLAATDAARRADDKAFAEALPVWISAGRPSADALPIESVSRTMVHAFLEGAAPRRLLVVLMDGMSWANAVQLLTRLNRENWAPVAWQAPTVRGSAQFPVVMAELPTITAQSRAAFFAGKHDSTFGNKATAEDAERWKQNRAIHAVVGSEAVPQLVMKSGLMNGEDLHADVKVAIDGPQRVVGVIVNAIDDQLKGSSQLAIDYSRVPIKPLEGLLHAADGAERAVLLVSDHGHAPGDAMKNHGQLLGVPTEGGRRWRVLKNGEEPLPFEVRLPADTWRPAGASSVAAIWDDGVAHGAPCFGEHGGASLAEVVAPAILIAPDWLANKPGSEDSALTGHELVVPAWWKLEVPPVVQVTTESVRAAPVAPRSPPTVVALFPDRPPVAIPVSTQPPVRASLGATAYALSRSATFKRQVAGQSAADIDRILKCIDTLAGEPTGTLPESTFAERCGILRRHVAGTVARLGVLNCDGFTMVEHNAPGQQVVLHRDRLAQQYGLST